MDFVEGITLRTEISRSDEPFTYERILEILVPVCSALAYAHKEGIVHCDVKPANIMIEKSGKVYLSDFGIAHLTEGATTMTMAGAGTPAYMSPEQIRGEEPTPLSDIYALGIVLYEMLTGGERPFTGEQASVTGSTGEKVRWEQLNLQPTSPRVYNPKISREVEVVVMQCLEKDLDKRYAGAIVLLQMLQLPTLAEKPITIVKPPVLFASPPVAEGLKVKSKPDVPIKVNKPKTKRLPWIIAGVGVALLLLLLAGIGMKLVTQAVSDQLNPEQINTISAATVEADINHLQPTLTPTLVLDVGSTQISPKDGMVMVYVPPGKFIMGSEDGDSDESPVHTVYLDAYWIDQTEVTNAMYQECVAEGNCTGGKYYGSNFNGDRQPVIEVDWYQAEAYCTWAGRMLPSEAEWEKAARGENGQTYPWGEDTDPNNANYGNIVGKTTAVGNFSAGVSPYQAWDMAGNVWEWVNDFYINSYYSNQSEWSNPTGPNMSKYRVLRGGAWNYYKEDIRTTNREKYSPNIHANNIGFRCAFSGQ
jgi:eukaryotic-like serine/threonine-protein kinase